MVYFWKIPLKTDDPHKDPNNQQDRVISAQCQGVTYELKSREGFGELPCWGGGAEYAAWGSMIRWLVAKNKSISSFSCLIIYLGIVQSIYLFTYVHSFFIYLMCKHVWNDDFEGLTCFLWAEATNQIGYTMAATRQGMHKCDSKRGIYSN